MQPVRKTLARAAAPAPTPPVRVLAPPSSVQYAGALRVSSPEDAAEKEAESTARRIVSMPEPLAVPAAPAAATAMRSPWVARFANAIVQRAPLAQPDTSSNVASEINAAQSSGSPLPPSVRRFMEPRFGADFSGVRVHTGERAAKLNRQLSARAFTVGNQIFFGKERYRPDNPEGRELIAHELTHTLQQGAASQDAGVKRAAEVAVRERSSGEVQRGWLPDPREFIAGKASAIPGFTMFTVVIGFNPITNARVERSAGNLLKGAIELIPGGSLITDALENHGIFAKVSAWAQAQFEAIRNIGSTIWNEIEQFIKGLDITDLGNLGGLWERGKRIVTAPIERMIAFARNLKDGIVQLVKDAILKPIGAFARTTRGYPLLCSILGKDPITGEAAPQDAESLMGAFMTFIGEQELWETMKKANAIARTFAWFKGAVAALKGFVAEIPGLFVAAFKSLELLDIVLVPRAFVKLAKVFGGFAGRFISWGANAVWNLLEIIFDVVKPGVMGYIKRTGAALKAILRNPLPFVGNLVKAAKQGFLDFAGRIGGHLKAGLIDWLTGSLSGVYIPKALTLPEMGKLAMSVLGITWAQIRGKIVKVLGPSGETIMQGLEKGFDIVVALVKGGPAAAWELVKEKLTDLKDTVVGGITDFVVETIVKKAIPKLVAMFIPGAGFVSAILSIYDTVMVFVQKIAKIIQVVTAFIDSIVAIAGGAIGAAAKRVESILAGLLSLAISFLAGFLGLGKVTDKIMAIVAKVRGTVDKALDAAIAWIVGKAKSLFGKLFGKGDNKKDHTPDRRTEEQKKQDKLTAIRTAERLLPSKGFDAEAVRSKLPPIKERYKLLTLDLLVAPAAGGAQTVRFSASASEVVMGDPKTVAKGADSLNEVTLKKPFVAKEKKADGKRLAMTRDELRRQVQIQQSALSNLTVGVWRKNWAKFYAPGGGRADESQANRDRETAIAAERLKVAALWMSNNPGKPISEANAFLDQLFTRNPGDKSYPFRYKSRVSNGIEYVNPAYGKTILHAADQAAGGGSDTAGLGGARENFSIGAQWERGGRAQILKDQLDAEITAAGAASEANQVEKLKLKVVLPVVDG